MKRINKKGQETFGISFGMIFSMFLIVVFIVVAFIAIKHFLSIGKTAEVNLFYNDLQEAINNAWESQSGEFNHTINLPSGITTICFANLTAPNINKKAAEYDDIIPYQYYGANTFLLPASKTEGNEYSTLQHLNISKITATKNPYCVSTKNQLRISKNFYDRLVSIR